MKGIQHQHITWFGYFTSEFHGFVCAFLNGAKLEKKKLGNIECDDRRGVVYSSYSLLKTFRALHLEALDTQGKMESLHCHGNFNKRG